MEAMTKLQTVKLYYQLNDVFVVEQVQHITPDKVPVVNESLWTLLHVVMETSKKDLKKISSWSEETSPATAVMVYTML